MQTNRKHVMIDGEHINLELYRAIIDTKRKIKKQGDEERKLTAEAKSLAQKAADSRTKKQQMINKFFGWEDEGA